MTPDDDSAEENFSTPAELLLKETSSWALEELIRATGLLLDKFLSPEFDCGMTLDDDSAEENFSSSTELLLKETSSRALEVLIRATRLLLDSGSEPGMTEEEDGSLFGATLPLSSSPHAESKSTNIKIATILRLWQAPIVLVMTFRIKAPQ